MGDWTPERARIAEACRDSIDAKSDELAESGESVEALGGLAVASSICDRIAREGCTCSTEATSEARPCPVHPARLVCPCALSGLNPEAVPRLVEAAEGMLALIPSWGSKEYEAAVDSLGDALAQVKETP